MVQSKQGSPPNKCKSEYSGFHPPSSQWTPDRIDPSTISPLQFFNRYIKSRTPVILTQFPQEFKDFALDWNAIKTKAGQAVVKVEDQDVHSKQFGSGQIRRTMTIEELDEQLLLGQHYLTTQYHTKEDEEVLSPNLSRIQEYCQPPLTSMINDFPHRPQILGHLAPQQVFIRILNTASCKVM